MEPEDVASGAGGMEHNQLTSSGHHSQPRARQVDSNTTLAPVWASD